MLCEELEYSDLLDTASKLSDPLERMVDNLLLKKPIYTILELCSGFCHFFICVKFL